MLSVLKQPKGFYRNVLALMLPMIAQNLITQTVALADIFMVGVLGEQYLAAVTAANTPFFILMIVIFGVQSGVSIMVAQYWGKKDMDAISRVFGIGVYVAFSLCFAAGLAIFLFPSQVMGIVTNNADIIPIAARYGRTVAFAYAFNAVSGVYIATQRSVENTKIGVIVFGISSLTNIFLNWVLIFGKFGLPAMDAAGAALATLIARALEVVIITLYAIRDKRLRIKPLLALRPGRIIAKDFVKYASPVVLNETLWSVGTSVYQVIMGHMAGSTAILAAFTIAGNIERVLGTTTFAVGNATAVIVGREIGAGNRDKVFGIAKSLLIVSAGVGILAGGLLLLVRATLLDPVLFPLFDLSADARVIAKMMMLVLAIAIPFRTLTFSTAIGVLRGGGDVKIVLFFDMLTLYCYGIPAAGLCGMVLKTGITLVYIFMQSEDLIKTVFLYRRFLSKKWINDVTRPKTELS